MSSNPGGTIGGVPFEEHNLTDRLGEALARFEVGGDSIEDWDTIVAAARNWHALTNPTDELIERVSVAVEPLEVFTAENGLRAIRPRESAAIVRAVLDALTDTPTTEENPPQDFVND